VRQRLRLSGGPKRVGPLGDGVKKMDGDDVENGELFVAVRGPQDRDSEMQGQRGMRESRWHEGNVERECGMCVWWASERLLAAPVAALASGLTRTIPRAAAASQSCSSIRKTTAAEVVSFLPQTERKWVGLVEVARSAEIGRASVGWPRRNRCDAEPRLRHGLRPNRMLRRHAFVYQRAPLDAKPSRLGRAFMADRPMRHLPQE
jgi:hypothetical protein